jgi:hypothetical protein
MTLCIEIVKHYRYIIEKRRISMMGEHAEGIMYQNDRVIDHGCPEHHDFKTLLDAELGIPLIGAVADVQPFEVGPDKFSSFPF